MSVDTHRVLRVGVVFRGQLLTDKVLSERSDISVGTQPDRTVAIHASEHPDFPASIALAVLHKRAYHLVLPTDPAAAVNLRGGPAGRHGVSRDDVVEVKGLRLVPIEAFTGGSLVVGDVTLMFQFVRAGAVSTVTHEETVLRIGLVYDARLLTDRVFKAGEVVSVGAAKGDALVLPSVDYQGGSAIFAVQRDGRVKVQLPKGCHLRLATDGAPIDEAAAIRSGVARDTAEGLELSIGLKSRGCASLGPYNLLFQVVRQTITVPTMPRQTPLERFVQPLVRDPVWSTSFLVSVLVIGSLVGQALASYRSTGRYLERQQVEAAEVATAYEVLVAEIAPPEPDKQVADIKADERPQALPDKAPREKASEQRNKPEPPRRTADAADPTQRQRAVVASLERKTMLGGLGLTQGAGDKLFADADAGEEAQTSSNVFRGGSLDRSGPGADLLKLPGGGGGGAIVRVDVGASATFKRTADATRIASPKRTEKAIVIDIAPGRLLGGAASADVGKVVARKNSAVQRCYESALRQNPGLSGKVSVRFVVGTAGTITDVTVLGADGDFAGCIKNKFENIRGLPILSLPESFTQSYVFTKS